jgi:hypothetical protein
MAPVTHGLVPCEFCGKNLEDGRSLHHHQTGISPQDGQPWCPLAHREATEVDYEFYARLDVRGRPLVGDRYSMAKMDSDPLEESTWEPVASLAETMGGMVDDS